MKEVRNEFECTVPADSDVTITITFGDGQTGTTFFRTPDGRFVNGEVNNYGLGKGNALKGKTMLMTTAITKSNPDTEFASITYSLNQNLCEQNYSDKFNEGENTISYITNLKFT